MTLLEKKELQCSLMELLPLSIQESKEITNTTKI